MTELPQLAMVSGEDGSPLGVFDLRRIEGDAAELMYALAANSASEAAVDEVMTRFIDRVGAAAFGYTATLALRWMTLNLLEPTLQTVEATAPEAGMRLRRKLSETAVGGAS